jgi:hypothetical protein
MESNEAQNSPDPILIWLDSEGKEIKRGPYSLIGPEFGALRAINAAAGTLIPVEPIAAPPSLPTVAPALTPEPAPAPVPARPARAVRSTAPVRVTAPTQAPAVATPAVSVSWGELTIDRKKAQQIEARAQQIRAAGFALPQTRFAPGTRMIQEGLDTYRAIFAEWSARPLAEDVLLATAERIRAEQRKSILVRLGDLRMASDGTIGRLGKPSRLIEWAAWDQIFAALRGDTFPDGSRLLRTLDPELRAKVFNARIEAMNPDKVVKLGVRRHAEAGWSIFRVVGEKFPDEAAGDKACEITAGALRGLGYRGHVLYNPNSTTIRFDAASMADPVALDPTVGDIFRAGIKGSTNDAGGGAFKLDPFIGRIICINCTVADSYAPGIHKAHRGDMTEATAQIKSVADQANKVVKIMAADWKVLRDTPFRRFPWHKALKLDKEVKDELADPAIHAFDAIRNLVDGGVITTDTAQGQTVEALLRSYKKEPGDSVADLLNAATRAAHEELMDDIARDVLERRAGALLPVLARVARAEAPKMMPIP